MPHQCTDCGRVFDDGSKEMLAGCPDCGGNKFQFHADAGDVPEEATADPPDPPDRPGERSVARKVGNAATTVRDLVGSSPTGPPAAPDEPDGPAEPTTTGRADDPSDATVTGGAEATSPSAEDSAQASARSELVSPDELPPAPDHTPSARPTPVMDERTDPEPGADSPPATPREDRPALSELRAELNDQFESIKVLEPGQYELNLMSLYDREEYIIALQEDGKYTIQVPERWKDD